MNKIKNLVLAFFVISMMFSCVDNASHFISDAQQRAEVKKDLEAKMATLPNGDYFNILKED
ncbi:MAG: hypothetical protein IIX06_04985, partial [Bacteroidales bacterium]|nr:hypothetical protein [Bacteroidales bacterium]